MGEERQTIVLRDVRAFEMAASYLGGATFREVGEAFGVSFQRVQQILGRDGVGGRGNNCFGHMTPARWKERVYGPELRQQKRRQKSRDHHHAERRRHVAALWHLYDTLGHVPTTGELVHVLGKRLPAILLSWGRLHRDPYWKKNARMYRAAGMQVRETGWRGHRNREKPHE